MLCNIYAGCKQWETHLEPRMFGEHNQSNLIAPARPVTELHVPCHNECNVNRNGDNHQLELDTRSGLDPVHCCPHPTSLAWSHLFATLSILEIISIRHYDLSRGWRMNVWIWYAWDFKNTHISFPIPIHKFMWRKQMKILALLVSYHEE